MKIPSTATLERCLAWLIAGVLFVGVIVRWWDLAWHWSHMDDFGVAKSILDARQAGKFGWFAVPKFWTYSPAQFLITPLLISLDQSYRDLLFWGRLPSFFFASAGLLCWIVFYRIFDNTARGGLLFSLALIVCSWENIIFAKQMSNYALGVTAAICLLMLLVFSVKHPDFSWKRTIINSFLLALLSHLQYLIFFLLPAFWAAVFIFGLREGQPKVKWTLKNIIGGLFYGALIFPMVAAFVLPQEHHGIYGWNKGPNNEFFFTLPGGLWDNIQYFFTFYVHNSFLVFQSNAAFLPEGHAWLNVLTLLGVILFVLGLIRLARSKDSVRQYLFLFILFLGLTWVALICSQRLTLSPTRHHLLLLPLTALVMAEGLALLVGFFARKMKQPEFVSTALQIFCSLSIVTAFLLHYPVFLSERRDPFDEAAVVEALKRYQVDALATAQWVQQPELMKSVRDYFDYNGKKYVLGQKFFGIMTKDRVDYRSVAVVSSEASLDQATFEEIRRKANEYIYSSNMLRQGRGLEPLDFWRYPFAHYHVVYRRELGSLVEGEYSSRTKHGRNGFYFYVFQR